MFVWFEVLTQRLWRMPSSGMFHRVALVRTDVSEERSTSIIRVTRIMRRLLVTANVPSSPLSPWWWRCYVPPKHRFFQEPHVITSQKTAFFHMFDSCYGLQMFLLFLFIQFLTAFLTTPAEMPLAGLGCVNRYSNPTLANRLEIALHLIPLWPSSLIV
jgi:hypothetical protein